MFIVDLLTALFAPIFIPIIEQFYSKTKKTAKVQGTKGNYIVTLSISEFVKQLPSAFIANTIWGLTYKTNIVVASGGIFPKISGLIFPVLARKEGFQIAKMVFTINPLRQQRNPSWSIVC